MNITWLSTFSGFSEQLSQQSVGSLDTPKNATPAQGLIVYGKQRIELLSRLQQRYLTDEALGVFSIVVSDEALILIADKHYLPWVMNAIFIAPNPEEAMLWHECQYLPNLSSYLIAQHLHLQQIKLPALIVSQKKDIFSIQHQQRLTIELLNIVIQQLNQDNQQNKANQLNSDKAPPTSTPN